MTETELVMASLTLEELDEARRFVTAMDAAWEVGTKDGGTRRFGGFRTDGPFHAINALRLAVMRELVDRAGGAEPWYAGMTTEGHEARRLLELYQRRFELRELEPQPAANGVLQRVCVVCYEAKPQDERHFARIDGLWADRCRLCDRPSVENIPLDALMPPAATEPAPEPASVL